MVLHELRDIGDVWDYLEELREPGLAPPLRSGFGKGGWVVAGAFALIAATLAFLYFRETPPHTPVVTRFRYNLPEGQHFTRTGRHAIAISPDGTSLVYVANSQLYLRSMGQLEAAPIRGTNEDPLEPVFSPDGQWIAYFVPEGTGGSQIRKVAVSGGAPVTLGSLARGSGLPFGAVWNDGNIVFALNSQSDSSFQVIPDSGGPARTLWKADPKKERVAQPRLLADGKHMIFVSQPVGAGLDAEGNILVSTLDGRDRRKLVGGGTDPHVLPSGHLLYVHDSVLFAVPFDVPHLAVTGGPVPLLEGVTESAFGRAGQFAISQNSTLAYLPGSAGSGRRLVWVDREGHEQAIAATPKQYSNPRLAPDGTRFAVYDSGEEHDLWIFDLAKQTLTRETFGPAFEYNPLWAADGRHLFYASGPSAWGPGVPFDIYRKAADGTGTPEALTENLGGGFPLSLAPGGTSLIYTRNEAGTGPVGLGDLYRLPLEPKGPAQPLLVDPAIQYSSGEVSPDGQWIAYVSNESGRAEVYVRPFPAVNGGRWQVSPSGGDLPAWARSGSELFFLDAAGRMSVVAVQPGPGFRFGAPRALFDTNSYNRGMGLRNYDVSPDGSRFLMLTNAAGPGSEAAGIVVVSHWFEEVKAKMPAQK